MTNLCTCHGSIDWRCPIHGWDKFPIPGAPKQSYKKGQCSECGYVFKPKDGKFWKTANICSGCVEKLKK